MIKTKRTKKNNFCLYKCEDTLCSLKGNNELFKSIFENANDAIWLINKDVFIDCNIKAIKMFKCNNKKDMINHTPIYFSPTKQPDGQNSKDKALNYIKKAFSGNPQKFYWQHKKKNGELFDTEISLNKFKHQKKSYLLAIGRDITNRKLGQERLLESEERFRNIFNYSAVGVSLIALDGHWLEVNNALCRITGYSCKELLSNKYNNITYKDDKYLGAEATKKLLSGKITHAHFIKRYINKKGNIVWVNLSIALVRDFKKKPLYFVTHTQDITLQKLIEEKQKISEEKFRRLFEAAKDSILILDVDTGEITDSNPFIQDMLGYSPKELIGKKVFEISPFKDIIKNKEKLLELQNKGYVYYNNLPLQSKLGVIKNVEFVSNVYMVGTKKVIQCNIRDISERISKERELDQAKNDFLSLTSHQLRTPLSATKWVLETLVKGKESLTLKQQKNFYELIISNERLINLVNRLLDVSRIESGKLIVNKKLTDIKEIINDLVFSFKILADKKGKVINVIAPSKLKKIFCDPVLTSEAIENFLSNAINFASKESKDIDIEINEKEKDYVISVHNSGSIDSSSIKKIKNFQKFTRGINAPQIEPSGSGLGLYITKKAIEASGGTVWFESNTKNGTTFYLTIIKN